MLPLLSDDILFHKLAQNTENARLLQNTYNVFQWIFCHRFLEDDLMHIFYSSNPLEIIDMSITSNNMTPYRGANLKIIILAIKKHDHLKDKFHLYNSYEKISWETFITVIHDVIPNFDSLQFGIFLEEFFQKNDSPLVSRFVFDFHNSHEWFEYINNCMSKNRINTEK